MKHSPVNFQDEELPTIMVSKPSEKGLKYYVSSKRATLCYALVLIKLSVLSYLVYALGAPQLSSKIDNETSVERILCDKQFGFLPFSAAKEYCSAYHFDVYPNRDKPRKVYDLFMMNSELDMLEVRLGIMSKHVDYFVIVEATTSFTGVHKPLYVKENWSRFKKYHDKIILYTLDLANVKLGDDQWRYEEYNRNAVYYEAFQTLKGPQKPEIDDILLYSDVDEIPKPETLVALHNCAIPQRITLASRLYYYSFQWLHQGDDWLHPQATLYAGDVTLIPQDLRANGAPTVLYNSAWHCSYCFRNVSEIVQKLEFFSHKEFNLPSIKDPQRILDKARNGYDLFDRSYERFFFIPNNLDIPEYLKQNKDKYKFMLNRDPLNGNFEDL